LKRRDEDESGSSKRPREEVVDEESKDIEEKQATDQWKEACDKIQKVCGQEVLDALALNFKSRSPQEGYKILNQFLFDHADLLTELRLDVLCDPTLDGYKIMSKHFPVVKEWLEDRVVENNEAAYTRFQTASPSHYPTETLEPFYSPSESVSTASPHQRPPKRNRELLAQVVADQPEFRRRLDRNVLVRVEVLPNGEIGVNHEIIQTDHEASIEGRASVADGRGSQMRHVTPVAFMESIITNAVQNIRDAHGPDTSVRDLALYFFDKIDQVVDVRKEAGFVITPQECEALGKDPNCPT